MSPQIEGGRGSRPARRIAPALAAVLGGGRRKREYGARALIESAHDAILVLDRDGVIVSANGAAERLYGFARAELAGRPWPLLLAAGESGEARNLFAEGIGMMAESGIGADAEFRRGDGRVICVEFTVSRAGAGYLTIARDVSEQRRIASALREQTQRVTALAEAQARIAEAGRTPEATMVSIAECAAGLLDGDGAAVAAGDRDDLVCRAAVGAIAGWIDLRIPAAGGDRPARATVTAVGERLQPGFLRALCREAGLRSLVTIPLDAAGRRVTLMIGRASGAAPHGDDLRTLELFATMASSVLHRAEVERRLAATNAVSRAHSDASLADGAAGTAAVLAERLGWDAVAVWLAERDGTRLRCVAHRPAGGASDERFAAIFGEVVPASRRSPLTAAFGDGAPLWIDPTREQEDIARRDAARASGMGVLVCVPLTIEGEVLGVVELYRRGSRSHDLDELRLLESIAGQLSSFVRRRRAELRVAEQADGLAAVVELSQMLAGVPVARMRFALCAGIRAVADCDAVRIYEPDPAGGLRLTADSSAGDGDGADGDGAEIDLRAPAAVEEAFSTRTALRLPAAGGEMRIEPVIRDGEPVAVLALLYDADHDVRPGSQGLIGLLASEASTTLALADLVGALGAQARTDQLTGLPNRRTWDEELPRELARARRTGSPVTVAMLDLDHFKRYNDSFGHSAGDRLLRAVAAGWSSRLRETDLLARYGGEEFGVVLPDCDLDSALAVLDELRLCMPDGTTCSIGAATWDGREAAIALVDRADRALYRAKRSGRNRIEPAVGAG